MTKQLKLALVLLAIYPLFGCSLKPKITHPGSIDPQNLISLCPGPSRVDVLNQIHKFDGAVTQSEPDHPELLAGQLLPLRREYWRKVTQLRLELSAENKLAITAVSASGQAFQYQFPEQSWRCEASGELVLSKSGDEDYNLGVLGKRLSELGLWINTKGQLILHNYWVERKLGVVTSRDDKWARADKVDEPIEPVSYLPLVQDAQANCAALDGRYQITGEKVLKDGRLEQARARYLLLPDAPIWGASSTIAIEAHQWLEVKQPNPQTLELSIHQPDRVLSRRELTGLSCQGGVWQHKGEHKHLESMLWVYGYGGAEWEDLQFRRNTEGELLVWRREYFKGVVLLIPAVWNDYTFAAFPPASLDQMK